MTAKRPEKYPPHGMEDYDLGALSDQQQIALTSYKVYMMYLLGLVFICEIKVGVL